MESRSQGKRRDVCRRSVLFWGGLSFFPWILSPLPPPFISPPPPFFFSSIPNPVPTPLAPFLHGASFLPALSNSPALPCQVDSAKYRKYSCRGNRGKTPPRGLSGAAPPPSATAAPPSHPPQIFSLFLQHNITPPLPTHTHTQTSFPLWHNAGAAAQPPPPFPSPIEIKSGANKTTRFSAGFFLSLRGTFPPLLPLISHLSLPHLWVLSIRTSQRQRAYLLPTRSACERRNTVARNISLE